MDLLWETNLRKLYENPEELSTMHPERNLMKKFKISLYFEYFILVVFLFFIAEPWKNYHSAMLSWAIDLFESFIKWEKTLLLNNKVNWWFCCMWEKCDKTNQHRAGEKIYSTYSKLNLLHAILFVWSVVPADLSYEIEVIY